MVACITSFLVLTVSALPLFPWCLYWRTCCCCHHFVPSSVLECHCLSFCLETLIGFIAFWNSSAEECSRIFVILSLILVELRLQVLANRWEVKTFLPEMLDSVTIHFIFFEVAVHAHEKLPPPCGFNKGVSLEADVCWLTFLASYISYLQHYWLLYWPLKHISPTPFFCVILILANGPTFFFPRACLPRRLHDRCVAISFLQDAELATS